MSIVFTSTSSNSFPKCKLSGQSCGFQYKGVHFSVVVDLFHLFFGSANLVLLGANR